MTSLIIQLMLKLGISVPISQYPYPEFTSLEEYFKSTDAWLFG